jgi:hypothetical protein
MIYFSAGPAWPLAGNEPVQAPRDMVTSNGVPRRVILHTFHGREACSAGFDQDLFFSPTCFQLYFRASPSETRTSLQRARPRHWVDGTSIRDHWVPSENARAGYFWSQPRAQNLALHFSFAVLCSVNFLCARAAWPTHQEPRVTLACGLCCGSLCDTVGRVLAFKNALGGRPERFPRRPLKTAKNTVPAWGLYKRGLSEASMPRFFEDAPGTTV